MLKGQTVTKENLLQWIENYRWMVGTIEEARQLVAKVDNNSYIGTKTAMYGIEATYQRQVVGHVILFIQKYNVVYIREIIGLRNISIRLQNCIPFVEGDREVEVFHRLQDGNSMRANWKANEII